MRYEWTNSVELSPLVTPGILACFMRVIHEQMTDAGVTFDHWSTELGFAHTVLTAHGHKELPESAP